jgi:hypothetical protein
LAFFLFDFSFWKGLEVTPNRPESAGPRIVELALLGNRTLQTLIRGNFVCFPSQAPVFGQKSRRDLQWRLAVLYFVRGWSTRLIADRYGLTRERCGQIISDWRIRAIALGYIQDVTPEGTDLARLAETHTAALPGTHQTVATMETLVGGADSPALLHTAVRNTRAAVRNARAVASKSPTIERTSFAISTAGHLPSTVR